MILHKKDIFLKVSDSEDELSRFWGARFDLLEH